VSLPIRVSNWNLVCILNFSSEFFFSYMFHYLPVHLPPPFTAQYKSCSSSLCSFVHPSTTPSVFKHIISLSPCSSTTFCYLVVGKQTQTHIIEHNSVYPKHLFINKTCCVQSVSIVWIAVYDIQLIRYKPVMYAHKPCGIIRKPTYYSTESKNI